MKICSKAGNVIADIDGKTVRELALIFRADLQGADLQGADLWGADLRCANLQGADLRGARISVSNNCIDLLMGLGMRIEVETEVEA